MSDEDAEQHCAKTAAGVIRNAGGAVTFDQYDHLIREQPLFAPLSWCQGWDDPILHRRNIEKLAAFAAVRCGLIKATEGGYEVKENVNVG